MANNSFSTTLQMLRKERKVTQEQLASHLGVSPQAVSKWENGSYPEGDLLPRIADFFEVSIDYLYGRTDRDKSFEQMVFEKVREVSIDDYEKSGRIDEHKNFAKLIKNIIWAIQTGSWVNNEHYWERPTDPIDYPKMASAVVDNVFYSYAGLREDNDFYLFLHDPTDKNVLDDLFQNTEKVEALFQLLSDRENITIMAYLYSLEQGEYAGIDTIAKATGIKKSKVEATLKELQRITTGKGVKPIKFVREVTMEKENEIYGVDSVVGGLFMGLMMIAGEYVDAPQGYSMQMDCRRVSWLKKKQSGGKNEDEKRGRKK
jgi:transcriptional regulator with XRE-family HTH domain